MEADHDFYTFSDVGMPTDSLETLSSRIINLTRAYRSKAYFNYVAKIPEDILEPSHRPYAIPEAKRIAIESK